MRPHSITKIELIERVITITISSHHDIDSPIQIHTHCRREAPYGLCVRKSSSRPLTVTSVDMLNPFFVSRLLASTTMLENLFPKNYYLHF